MKALIVSDIHGSSYYADKIKEIKSEDSYVSIKDVPDYYINAIIAVEDHRFESHGPVDFIAIGRAVFRNIKEFRFTAKNARLFTVHFVLFVGYDALGVPFL